jgi:hypothetical protein
MRRDVVGTLGRILPLAAGVGRGVRRLGLVGLAAAAAIALIVLVRWTPGDGGEWAGLAILAVLLAVPAAVLFAFSVFLGEVVELPDKLRNYPGLTREHATELAALVRSARELLAPHAPLLPLLNVPFLIATVVAALLVPLVALAALIVLLAAVA